MSASHQPVVNAPRSAHLVDVGRRFFTPDGDWPQLGGQVGGWSFFLGPEWLGTWWGNYGETRRPLVFRVDENTHPIAAIPLCVGKRRLDIIKVRDIGWVGSGELVCPEHMDALGSKPASAAEGVTQWLTQHIDTWDVVRLLDSRPGGFATALAQRMANAGFSTQIMPCSCCPRIKLPATYRALIDGYSYNMRRTVLRINRRLQRAGGYRVEWFDVVSDGSDQSICHALDNMSRLHSLARSAHNQRNNFSDAAYRAFQQRLIATTLESGALRLAFLYHNDNKQPIAFRYGFLHEIEWLDYQTGYDTTFHKQRVGWYLLGECLQRAISDGANMFDMLRGDHEYKRHWATACRDTETVWIFNNNLQGHLTRLTLYAKRLIKSLNHIGSGPES